ncbi:MAG: glycosyltransferase family 2 protein [bacterium]
MNTENHKPFLCSVIIPVFNEEKNIDPLLDRLVQVLTPIEGCSYEIIFAMDPCTDKTEEKILAARKSNPCIKLLRFSRRFGQPASTIAGLEMSSGDICVVIDADLQDPPELIATLIARWQETGAEVVYAQRLTRKGETALKKVIAYLAYYVINKIADVKLPRNTGDFRLMSRRVVDHVLSLKENHGFLRGLVALVGFKQEAVQYHREARLTGKGNYNRWTGSFLIGFNGIYGFSRFPLVLISLLGAFFSTVSVLAAILFLVMHYLGTTLPVKDPVTLCFIVFFTGMQMLCLGVVGGYIGRIYDEVKERPKYIIESSHGFE